MTAIVFSGPSIDRESVAAFEGVTWLPPAAQGDVYHAVVSNQPIVIGLIDGYFEGVPSVWHKEILWAMSEGVHVFGSASMGALRAAELYRFGMRGVGSIFEQFRDGLLEDDDEVALLHGPAETGFVALSEAMVNVRATLEYAVEARLLPEKILPSLLAQAKAINYKNRTWSKLIEVWCEEDVSAADSDMFTEWLEHNVVNLKELDARCLLNEVAGLLKVPIEPHQPAERFEWTENWDRLARGTQQETVFSFSPNNDLEELVINELRSDPKLYQVVTDLALLRMLAETEYGTWRRTLDHNQLRATMRRFRERHGLLNRNSLMAYVDANKLEEHLFDGMIASEHALEALRESYTLDLRNWILKELKLSGRFAELARLVRDRSGP